MALFEARSAELKQYIKNELNMQREKMQEQLKEEYKQLLSNVNKLSHGKQNDSIHQGITCSVCSQPNIKGVRYECAICNYHLCQSCESSPYRHASNHPMIKIKHEWQRLTNKDNKLGKKLLPKNEKTGLVSELMELLQVSEG